MIILQGAIHIFTEQPNSVAKSIYNGLRRQMTHLLEYETINNYSVSSCGVLFLRTQFII